MDGRDAHAKAGAYGRRRLGYAGAAGHLAEIAPLRRRVGRSDEQRAFEPAIDEERRPDACAERQHDHGAGRVGDARAALLGQQVGETRRV